MCKHNEEDGYDCSKCCMESGMSDAEEGLPRKPEYKDFSQCYEYYAGYDEIIRENQKRSAEDEISKTNS